MKKHLKENAIKRMNILITAFALACFVFAQLAQAVVPAPDGGYPNFNTAEGQKALLSLTTGAANTAVGSFSLLSNTDGSSNTGVGAGTLLFNVGDQNTGEGIENTAIGAAALLFNTGGSLNTAVGTQALFSNTGGSLNAAVGARALSINNTGSGNTAMGGEALFRNTTGASNTATGNAALLANSDGSSNTATGNAALLNNSSGNNNTAIGQGALYYSTGNGNTALGASAGDYVTTANNVIAIGSAGANVSDSCFIGRIYSNVQPIVGPDPDSVTITSAGRLGRGNVSSRRYKHDIQPMDQASEALYKLKPVSFRYHKEYDVTQTLAFGLIAEEVADVYPDLVGRNREGQAESVRYEQINTMLLNEFLKEHKKVQEQGTSITELKKEIQALAATVTQQAAQIQKVSAHVNATKPLPHLIVNNP